MEFRFVKTSIAVAVGYLIAGITGSLILGFAYYLVSREQVHTRKNTQDWTLPDIPMPQGFDTHKRKSAGDFGESLMQDELRRIKGNLINGYITSENMVHKNKNFEIDFLVLIPYVGLVIAEVKYHAGKVYCTSNNEWKQEYSDGQYQYLKNASLQALRTKSLFQNLLMSNRMDRWPLYSVVVYTHPKAKIFKGKKANEPQTDVLTLPMFESWIKSLRRQESATFSKREFSRLHKLIKAHERQYEKGY